MRKNSEKSVLFTEPIELANENLLRVPLRLDPFHEIFHDLNPAKGKAKKKQETHFSKGTKKERNGNWVCKYTISVSLYGPGDISRRLVRSVKGLPDGWQAGLLRLCLFCRYISARRTKSSGGASALGCSTSSRNDLFSGTLRSHALLGRGGVLWE